jgi:hypothetical protein
LSPAVTENPKAGEDSTFANPRGTIVRTFLGVGALMSLYSTKTPLVRTAPYRGRKPTNIELDFLSTVPVGKEKEGKTL